MMPAEAYTHGGDVERVARRSGIPAERILDFSANVNPLGLPDCAAERLARDARDPRLLLQYPDPDAHELRDVLSRKLVVPAESIVIGPGADSLIHASVRALAPRRVIIPVPAFSEYERACRAHGCVIRQIRLAASANFCMTRDGLEKARSGDLIILNNPHNPTGACASREQMLDRISMARCLGATVLADEAFIDYAPGNAITRDASAQTGIIAIRSLTKFFGCAGLRVGYAVAAPETARKVAAQLPAWPVTTLALNALSAALCDDQYIRETLVRNEQARMRLADALSQLGCRVLPSAANFLFIQIPDAFPAPDVRERLIREHAILVRECDSFKGLERGRYLRVAVRRESENAKLIEGLANVFAKPSCQ